MAATDPDPVDLGTGPWRAAVEGLYVAYADFHASTAHLSPWRQIDGSYWFLASFEAWLWALRDLSTSGAGRVPVTGGGDATLESLDAWMIAFADSWLDPAVIALSHLAQQTVRGHSSDEERAFGEALLDLFSAGLPVALATAGWELLTILPFSTPYDDRTMLVVATEPFPEARGQVVGVRHVGLRRAERIVRQPHVVVA